MKKCRNGFASSWCREWVEQGQAPDRVVATQSGPNGVIRTRPLFPHPAFAKYTGKGDVNNEASWISASPKKPVDDRLEWTRSPK
jgi:hypothetical protein